MPSRRRPLTEQEKAKKNAKLREKRAAETADAREKRLRENRERRSVVKRLRLEDGKSLETLSTQAEHNRMARQQETQEQRETRSNRNTLRQQVFRAREMQTKPRKIMVKTKSSTQTNLELSSRCKEDQNTSENTTEVGSSDNVKNTPPVLYLILQTPDMSKGANDFQMNLEEASKDAAPFKPTHPLPPKLIGLMYQHKENRAQMIPRDVEPSDPAPLISSVTSMENARNGIASDDSREQGKEDIPSSSSVHDSVGVQGTSGSRNLPNKTPIPKCHAMFSPAKATDPKRAKPCPILPRQPKVIPGILLTWSLNQVNQMPLAVPAVTAQPVESYCQKKKTLPIVCDSQLNKAKLSQLSVVSETRSLQEETTATSHTIFSTFKATQPKMEDNIQKDTAANKDTSEAAGKETSDKLHPVETVETCSRKEKSSN